MYDFYYFNGDSYSADHHGCWVNSYMSNIDVNYLNDAKPGSSNHRIFRSSIEQLLNLKNKYNKIMVIVGFSFVSRDEIWQDTTNELVTLDKVLKENKITDELKLKLHFQDINHQMVHFYTNLYMFVNLLEKWNIDSFIFSAADNTDFGTLNWDYLKQLPIYKEISNNPRIYPLHDLCVKKWAELNGVKTKLTGHLMDQQGFDLFADFIGKQISKLVK